MIRDELTEKILQTCFEVSNELGNGFLESVYQNALVIALSQAGLTAETQVALTVLFRGEMVGEFRPDILVNGRVLLELKAVKALAPEHLAQVINYLKATGIQVGLLVNFGTHRLEYRRLGNHFQQG